MLLLLVVVLVIVIVGWNVLLRVRMEVRAGAVIVDLYITSTKKDKI